MFSVNTQTYTDETFGVDFAFANAFANNLEIGPFSLNGVSINLPPSQENIGYGITSFSGSTYYDQFTKPPPSMATAGVLIPRYFTGASRNFTCSNYGFTTISPSQSIFVPGPNPNNNARSSGRIFFDASRSHDVYTAVSYSSIFPVVFQFITESGSPTTGPFQSTSYFLDNNAVADYVTTVSGTVVTSARGSIWYSGVDIDSVLLPDESYTKSIGSGFSLASVLNSAFNSASSGLTGPIYCCLGTF